MTLHEWMLDNNDNLLTFERFKIDELQRTRISEWVVESNWKIVIENYSECLHCPTVHPELVQAVPIYKTGWVFEPDRHDGGVNAVMGVDGPAGKGDVMVMPTMTGEEAESVFGGAMFPNMFMDITGTNIVISQVVPLTPTSTRVQSWYMFHPDQINSPGFDPTDIYAFNDLVTEQDNSVCVRAQHGATSRAYLDGGIYPEKDEFVLDFNMNYLRHRDRK
jgi:Rieske 2Fe-2S family protein